MIQIIRLHNTNMSVIWQLIQWRKIVLDIKVRLNLACTATFLFCFKYKISNRFRFIFKGFFQKNKIYHQKRTGIALNRIFKESLYNSKKKSWKSSSINNNSTVERSNRTIFDNEPKIRCVFYLYPLPSSQNSKRTEPNWSKKSSKPN